MTRLSYAEAKWTVGTDANLSAEIDLTSHRIVGIEMPGTWTAAAITFQGATVVAGKRSSTAGLEPLKDVFDSAGVEVNVTAAASHFIALTEAHKNVLAALCRVKLRSGVTGTPVAQGADRVVTLILEPRESNT